MPDFSPLIPELRRCKACGLDKSLSEYYVKNGRGRVTRLRYDSRCRTCHNERVKIYQTAHPEATRGYKLKWYTLKGRQATRDRSYRKFNATSAAYDLQLHAQHERCAICLRKVAEGEDRFAFDHDHATGLARGVLCPSCNGALGSLRDRRDLLLAAIRYLEYWERQHALATGTNGI